MLTGADATAIRNAAQAIGQVGPWKAAYGNGDAGGAILDTLLTVGQVGLESAWANGEKKGL